MPLRRRTRSHMRIWENGMRACTLAIPSPHASGATESRGPSSCSFTQASLLSSQSEITLGRSVKTSESCADSRTARWRDGTDCPEPSSMMLYGADGSLGLSREHGGSHDLLGSK